MTLFDEDQGVETLTVGALTGRIAKTLKQLYRGEVWVQGQIRNLSRPGRHAYFDLVDPVPAGQAPKASISVVLFESNRKIVNRILTRAGNGVRIDDGVEVRIRGTVGLYLPRGQAQLTMTAIDPDYTLGRLAVDRDQLLATLTAEGLIDANGERPLPPVPLRVALVTGAGSAAQADFCTELDRSGYAFQVELVATRTQGEFAPQEIADAVQTADAMAVDVVAIVRGGGAQTDLAAFDTEPVARSIAKADHAVICGIGHEIDRSVADTVAHTSVKTPTAAARFLIERVGLFDLGLTERTRRLVELAATAPTQASTRIAVLAAAVGDRVGLSIAESAQGTEIAAAALAGRVQTRLSHATRRLGNSQGELRMAARQAIRSAERVCNRHGAALGDLPDRHLRDHLTRLQVLEARVDAVHPGRALERGYSITLAADGTLVRDVAQVEPGQELTTRLETGSITSTVTSTEPTDRETEAP